MNARRRNRGMLLTGVAAGLFGLALPLASFAGELTVQSGSRYAGNFGMQVTPDATPAFVQSSHPSNEKSYRVRFYLNLTRLNLATNSDFDAFVAYSGSDPAPSAAPTGSAVVRLSIHQESDGNKYLDVFTLTDSGEVKTPTSPLLADGWRAIELEWRGATAAGASNGALNLWIDGVAQAGLASLDNDTRVVNYSRWGSVSSISLGNPLPGVGVNSFKVDDFASQRTGYVGLVNAFSDIGGLDQTFRQYVHAVYNAGLTNGCATNPLRYCPNNIVTRAEMAKFLEIGMRNETFTPPATGTSSFADVPANHWAISWIEQAFADGLTNGCALNPRRFCPDNVVNRAELAKFLLLAKHGTGYVPPPVASTPFADVPASHWAAPWITQLYNEGLTNGCATSPLRYCPDDLLTRWQMARALSLTFNLPVPNGL